MAQHKSAGPSSDRVNFVPQHVGPKILPNSPLFSRLLRFAHRKPPRLAVRDDRLGVEKTYIQLLADVLALRTAVRALLPSTTLEDLEHGAEIYIGVLAAGGYEYAVAVLAVLALGAAAVPMSTQVSTSLSKILVF
jgi:malonyl-CoA/methylmalonyl-CoA synthetase